MLRQPVYSPRRQQNARTKNLPAPIGGWNARDSIAAMPESDAVILTNLFPNTTGVALRNGSTNWATGLGNQVNSIMGYNPASGTSKLFAAAGGSVFDVTAGGAVGAAAIGSLSNDKWIHTNFATPAGPFLCMVNGADGYYVYNGTTWQSVTSGSSPISITGVNPNNLSFIVAYASRIWFIEKSSMHAWYLPVGQVGGAATQFDFSPIFKRGGSLVAMGVWTVDGGEGMQDYLAIVTSEGELAIYGGTDPSQATTFTKAGTYQVGTPMGNNCFLKYGGDLLYIGKDGLAPISDLLSSTRVNTEKNLTYKIQGAISGATSTFASNFGWQMVLHPLQNLLILNVPAGVGSQQQYVMNTITGAWCNFTGWAANCWERFNDKIYYGGNGVVVQAWTSALDDNGAQINGEGLQAFSYLDSPQLKQITMARPVIQSSGNPGILLGLNVDFDTSAPVGVPSFSQSPYGLWDQARWDVGIWGTDQAIKKDWQWVSGVGYTAAMHMKIAALDISVQWVSTDYLLADGGVL
jgi:hypothetical protein